MTEEPVDGGTRAEEPQAAPEDYELPPSPPPEPVQPRRVRRFRLAAWIALVLATVVVGASIIWVNGPPTEAELREQAGLFRKERLRIGVKPDTPYISIRKAGGGFEGFDIEIAYLIAADLGYPPDKVDFLEIKTEDRARMQATDDRGGYVKVDLVVATFSVTREREEELGVGFSTPYLFTEQSVITRKDHREVTSLGDLKGEEVCTLGTSTSEGELRKAIDPSPEARRPTVKNLISDCVTGLKKHTFDAVTTDAAILAGFVKDSNGALIHHDIALEKTEMWAVNAGSNTALRTLVDLALYRSYADPQDRRWEQAYARYIKPLLSDDNGKAGGVNVAQAEQPCAPPPPVRRWPWERALPFQECSAR
ncbi:transporter substrate-binding domain-containing protein [Streptosporangium sp. NPDC087985]|uniref:transporter substrate-binding domain-containing protein n=1 Tax=Streptosporangium sp. NPDC087985 TaxID=3366196 RepID=UPI0038106E83